MSRVERRCTSYVSWWRLEPLDGDDRATCLVINTDATWDQIRLTLDDDDLLDLLGVLRVAVRLRGLSWEEVVERGAGAEGEAPAR